MRPFTSLLVLALLASLATDASAQQRRGPPPGPAPTPPANSLSNRGNAPAVGQKVGGTKAPWERTGVSQPDWLLAHQLANVQHLRDVSQHNGNQRLREQADKLEEHFRRQHAIRNCHLEGHHHCDPTTP